MNNDYILELQNMTIEELKEKLEQFIFNKEESEDAKSGREIIDNLLKLRSNSSERVGMYIALYTIYKLKGGK